MGIISSLIKLGLVAGASITAYQASEKAKQETGAVKGDAFVKNFKDLAVQNTKLVVDSVKSMVGGKQDGGSMVGGKQDGGYRYSDKGENGYTYVDAEPAEGKADDKVGDKVNEVFEGMKEKAPEVIGKVQDFVEDVREHAPEYKEKAQTFVEGVKDAAKKALDDNKKDE